MLKVLVSGANGFVGKALCAALKQHGHGVRKAVRNQRVGTAASAYGDETVIVGNIDFQTDWSSALSGMDAVIHLAARVHVMKDTAADPLEEFRKVNVAGAENLARSAVAAGVKRLVYVSSIKVNGESTKTGEQFVETDIPEPQDPYAVSKYEAEQALLRVARETGLEVVIVRPPLVYGPGVKGNFAQMLRVLSQGMPLPLASVSNQRSLVYVGNLADALSVCAAHPAAVGQTYLVSDGEDISTPALLRSLAAGAGLSARLLPCPVAVLKGLARLAGKGPQVERLVGSLRVDSGKIRRELNWIPPYTLQQGLRATAEWYRTEHT